MFKLTLKSTLNDIPKFRDTLKVLDNGRIERINYRRKVPFEFTTFDYTVAYKKNRNWLYYSNCFKEIVINGKKFVFNSYNESEYLKQKYIKLQKRKTLCNKQKRKVFKEYFFKREEIT